jgi:hypothetical protein
MAFINQGLRKDRIPFLRAGFLQHPAFDNRLYLTTGLLSDGGTLSHAAAAAAPDVVPPAMTAASAQQAHAESMADFRRAFGL